MRLITFFEAVNQDTLSGGAGVLVFIPRTGRILVQIRGEHPDDKDSGKYDLFGGTLEEGETAEECARREAKEEGDLDFDELEEIGAFSSTENGDWDGEPYHVFLSVQEQEFPVKIDHDEVEKAGWVVPDVITDENATNRLVKVLQHEKLKSVLHNNLTEAHLFEGKKDQYYQMFQSVVDPVKDSGSKDIGEEVTKRIDQVIRTLGREDRILWALRIFKKMYLMELRSIAQKYNDPEKWPWGPTQEKQLKKLAAIDVSQVPKFLSPNYEQIPSYKPRDESRDTELVQLGWSDPNQWDRGRRYTKQNNELRKRNTEIISQHYEDKPHLFNFHSYAGLEALLNEVGHYIGVGEAHTDVEPNNPVVTYQFGNQPYGQVKRELARLTKPLERKYKAGDVAQGEVFLEISPEWRWELLSRTCRKEAKALGHCGGVRDPNIGPNDRLLSLRELRKIEDTERTRSFAHLTFVIDTQTGELSQMRGQANTKPKAQYHPYIVPLLLDKRVTGFKPVAWKPEGNFHLSDLQPAQINQIIIAKPNLLNSLEPEGKKAVMMKIGKRAPRRPSPAAAAARQQPQPPYPQMPRAMGEAVYPYAGYNFPGDWYHGMASSSRAFLRRKGSHPSNIGVWLTNNRNIAGQFAKQAARRMVDDQPILVVAKTMAENPLVFDTYREYLEMWREYGDSEKMRRSLMRKGHDSILIAKSDTDFGGEPRMDLAVFQPSMVKAVEKETLKTPVREGLDLFGDEEDEDEVETIAGWITEGGKILEGNLHEHVDLAYAELEERGYRPEEIMNKTGDDLMGIAWGLGWIRWVLESGVSLYANWFKTTPYAIRTLSTFVGSSYFDKGVTFEINRKPFEFPDAQKASGFLRKQATSITEQDSILDAVLAEPGQNPGIGDEKEKKITPEISMLVSPYGSYRFIYRKGGKIVSGLQVVSRDGKHATTANVKTHPDFLRQGLARELLGVARKKFKRVDHSEHLTGPGEKFAQGTG